MGVDSVVACPAEAVAAAVAAALWEVVGGPVVVAEEGRGEVKEAETAAALTEADSDPVVDSDPEAGEVHSEVEDLAAVVDSEVLREGVVAAQAAATVVEEGDQQLLSGMKRPRAR